MLERIEISIIPNDSKHEETILQITDCLDNLHSAASQIFKCIDERIAGYSERLSSIRTKTHKIENQLNYLQNNMSLKAIKMYSDAKYPANSTYQEYQTIITGKLPKKTGDTREKFASSDERVMKSQESSQHRTNINYYTPELNLKEKLQFYYVMGKSFKKKQSQSQRFNVDRVSSVSALLIDESSIESKEHSSKVNATNDKQIQDAPDSIGQPWHSSDFESPSYLYAPTLGEVPQINVPAILPDLPGIVDDERFVLDLNSQSPIAPSSAVTSPTFRVDLPDTAITAERREGKGIEEQVNTPNLPNIGDSENQQGALPPPPPPPPPQALPSSSASQPLPSTSSASVALPAPPPPPPPPPPPAPSAPEATSQASPLRIEPKKPVPSTSDDRTDLMAAIRAAGGVGKAKLRQTTSIIDKQDRFSSASVGGDLMADLHAKLSLRRKGIAGGGMGALERISRLIPPPPKPNEADRNSATSENDSQADNDEWEE